MTESMYKYRIGIVKEQELAYAARITSREDAVSVFNETIGLSSRASEVLAVLDLDAHGNVIGTQDVSVGTISGAMFDNRAVFRGAILNNAHGIIVAHNHPSGDPTPSADDMESADAMRAAGKLLGIRVLDVLVIAEEGYEAI